ncbi:Bug family tripartite tricarboxylate transporter substrate binding protein [Bradyrhizobium sp. SYSU BS000235]|uniref:Bug family tripartite tricarboxylate transporter substrate binding protein n=1 Tax=Bradyrhizobium sp. SYSU BS000235 TaxID=3411332 RepID=UPI003C71D00B
MFGLANTRLWALLAALFAAAISPSFGADEVAYPKQPVRIIVPYAAGGSTDAIARLVAKELSDELGQPFYVENKPGAGGILAHDIESKAPADGTTLLFSSAGPLTVTPHIQPKLPYKPIDDFAPIKLIATAPLLLVVRKDLPVKTFQELVDYARKQPGKLTYASFGYGSAAHLAGEMFKLREKVDILHVPFKGSAPALTALIGGEVDMMFDVLVTALPQVQAGNLRALAITADKRWALTPDTPTMAEAGLPKFEANTWFGLLARAGTPQPIIDKLSSALDKSLAKEEFRKALTTQGSEVAGGTPAQFNTFFRSEYEKWGAMIKEAGIQTQ